MTFLFTDIEGSTAMLRRVGEDVYARVLSDHHSLIRSALAENDGTELTMLGDGFFAAFSSPRACVAAVLEMQHALAAHDWPGDERVRVRMGVHTGEAEQTPSGPVGLDVHRAARIAGVAHGGQVLLSETAAALVRDSLPAGTGLRDLGVHRLKDLGRPERIYQLVAPGLQTEFPALQSLGNPTLLNNLPVQLSSFIGRQHEVKEIRSLVEASRLVTLTGAGGSGKTRLGLQVAAELLDGSGDGVWLVELAAITDPDGVAPAIADDLGVPGQPGRSTLDTLVDALAPQAALILLDNCEHLIDACAAIAAAIVRRCPKVHVLATSREPLGIGGEVIYRVPSMSLPATDDSGIATPEPSDAVALFADRARKQGVDLPVNDETTPLIVSVCRRLDGMPLAIELAAARLSSLSVGELRDRLDQRFRLLTGGSRAAMARQQTLLATVDWSYSLLDAAEQRLLRRLAVFPESFDLEAAEAACGIGSIDVLDVLDLLGSLVNKSLVVTEQAADTLRYRLLETIRQFAADRLVEAGEDEAMAVGDAHSAHFLAVAERTEPHLYRADQGRWFARLDTDRANFRRATEHAVAAPDGTDQALRFGVALRRYWMARDMAGEINALLDPVVARPEARADLALYTNAALTSVLAGRHTSASAVMPFGAEVIELARRVGDPRLLAEALAHQCGNYYFTGEPEGGIPLGEEAVALARQIADDVVMASCLMGYLLCRDVTDPAGVDELYDEAIDCTARSGDRLFCYLLHNNASVHSLRARDYSAARAHLIEASEIMVEIGETSHHVSVNLGWVLLRHDHDSAAARAKFELGLRASRRGGDRAGVAYSSLGLACLAGDLSRWQLAATLHGVAQAFVDRIQEPWQEPEDGYRLESIGLVRENLGADQFGQFFAQGMTLSFDDAVALALGDEPARA